MLTPFTAGIIILVILMTGPISPALARADETAAIPTQEIVGIWLGTLEAGGERVRVVFKISKGADGALVATMDSPDRGRKDLAVTRIDWHEGSLHLEGVGGRVFNGELNQDTQELVGEWQQSGHSLPLKLGRVDRAPEFDVPFPAGLYLAAALTSCLALLLIGGFILKGAPRSDHRFLATIMAVHLPMSPIAFYWVRLPVKAWLAERLGPDSPIFAALDTMFAPLTEEPAKLWLLMVPWFFARVRPENAPRLGMAIGLGFGIGETWMIAGWLTTDPQIAGLPWYMFGALGGYISERFISTICHGVFTATALRMVQQAPLRGILCAMGLHFVGNFPIALKAWDVGGLGQSVWLIIVQNWVTLFFFAMLFLLNHYFKSADPMGWRGLRHYLLGQARCPECGLLYERSWFAVNMGRWRYERCPGCKNWHVTTTWKEPHTPGAGGGVGPAVS